MRVGKGLPAGRRLGRALLAALALLAGTAQAWGPIGHQAVGAVADAMLRPRAQAVVADLLAEDLDRDGRPSGRHTLSEVADWADEIRGGPLDHPRWHYDNRPICDSASTPAQWCADGQCASAQLPALLATLADGRHPRAERNLALKWVVHLVGDLHQPLHAADLAEGGNAIDVDSAGTAARAHRRRHAAESLHAYWDSTLVNQTLHPADGAIAERALQRLLRDARATDAATRAAPPQDWAVESNDIAHHFALELDGVDCSLNHAHGRHEGPTVSLSRDYLVRARRIVEQRLALAGARLAYVLNERLDPQ